MAQAGAVRVVVVTDEESDVELIRRAVADERVEVIVATPSLSTWLAETRAAPRDLGALSKNRHFGRFASILGVELQRDR